MRSIDKELVFESDRLKQDFEKIVNDKPVAKFATQAFNELIGGGVRPLFYALGASPGCGKTTVLLQMADELAAAGHKVIFFSLELSAPKLVAKSLSRISQGTLPVNEIALRHDAGNDDALSHALEEYSARIAGNIAFMEVPLSVIDMSVIVSRAERDLQAKPIIFCDYLQAIPSASDSKTMDERSAIKETVAGLCRIVRGHDVPLFCISSISRSTYGKSEAGLDAYSGSSATEYSSDVALFLSTAGKGSERQENMLKPVRPVTITALKNRYFPLTSINMMFDTRFATFYKA